MDYQNREKRDEEIAQYERERRHAASEAMSILAEATGCDATLSNADILATALAQLQRASERDPEDDIAHIRRCNEKLLLQVEILEERLSNWEEPENNTDAHDNEEITVSERKRKGDFDENKISKMKKCKSEENILNTSLNSDIIDSDTLEMFCSPSDLNIIESVCSEWVNEETDSDNKDDLGTLDSFIN
ncbi:hypothetical protein KGM_202293 [Danaus plexippus plexippus]|uniref:Uncharacterized protein n=1 Tax=Danaus plexippus plexippus TaxID=278856 RepID=A0A212ENK3_DANPL|nr:hypothetical protein KGM_202293 [Danaus plexippus plexippus]